MRNAAGVEQRTELLDAILMADALEGACLEVSDGSDRAGGQRRRQRRREDEAGGERADEVAERRRGCDITAHHAEGLAERTFDDGEPVHQPFALCNAAATRAVHAHRMHLVEIGHRAVAVGQIADLLDRRDIAIHGIDRFEGDQLRRIGIGCRQLGFQIVQVVVLPDHPLALAVADALDHRGMVQGIGKDDQAGDLLAKRAAQLDT